MDMQFDDFTTTIKCVVLGNGRVGKSTLAKLFCQGVFTETYKKTIGVDFMEKQFEVEELAEPVHMMIWDTAGQEEFNSLTTRYYKGAGAAVLVFSTTDRESFEKIESWHQKVRQEWVGEGRHLKTLISRTEQSAARTSCRRAGSLDLVLVGDALDQ